MIARLTAARAWLRGRHRWWVVAAFACVVGLASAWASFLVTPPSTVHVGVVSAQIKAVPGTGTVVRSAEGRAVTDAALVRGPLQVQVDVAFRSAPAVSEPRVLAAINSARPTLIHTVEIYLARVAGGALVIAVALTALLFGVGWTRLLVSGATSVGLVAAGVGITVGTMRLSSFDAASCAHGWSRYAVADLPALTPPAPVVRAPAAATAAENAGLEAVEVIADDHLNPEGLRFAKAIAGATDARAVLDAGDTTSYGVPGEACVVVPLIRALRLPYVWVRGNHDSPEFARTMQGTPGVHALDGSPAVVAGLTVWGVADPSFTPRRRTTTAEMTANDAGLRATVADRIESTGVVPDVVLAHECPMVASKEPGNPGVADVVPLVVCGHTHRYAEATIGSTTLLHTGTVGAGGLDAFATGQLREFSALVLYFTTDPMHRLVKYYEVSGQGGGAAHFTLHVMPAPTSDRESVLDRTAHRRLGP